MRQQALLFSQVMFSALHNVDTQLDTVSHPHSREYRIVKLDAQMSSLHLLLQLLPTFDIVTLGTFKILFIYRFS